MNVTIYPSGVSGSVMSPRSKSSMQRACAAALLRKGRTEIRLPGTSNDDKAALDVIQKLGAIVDTEADRILVSSQGVEPLSDVIHCGESGLGIRMFTPIAALCDKPLRITGSGSLVTRPMHFFDEIFPLLSIDVQSTDGHLPLQVKGPLKPADISVDGSLSSQFLTGLLMAYSAAAASGVTIHVRDLKSRPYIDLTLSVMRSFGMHLPEATEGDDFIFHAPVGYPDQDIIRYAVEGDWSGASFLIVAAAIAGDLRIEGLQEDSVQADKAILTALTRAGGVFQYRDGVLEVRKSVLRGFEFDATECPDLFPPLVAMAAHAKGTTLLRGVSRLAHKESDRGLTLQEEFGKLGVAITLEGDLMRIDGGDVLRGASTRSHHDHRIAMAVAVAALAGSASVTIDDAEAIRKSYPDFFRDLASIGARVEGF